MNANRHLRRLFALHPFSRGPAVRLQLTAGEGWSPMIGSRTFPQDLAAMKLRPSCCACVS